VAPADQLEGVRQIGGIMTKRRRRIGSVKLELLHKSREAALSAVSIFNNPQISFKSESFIVLMVIAWTYLLHAYFRSKGIEYREYKQGPKRRSFIRTKHGSFRHWQLERCLNDAHSPIDRDTANNLRFLIGLRHEIEHQMTLALDDYVSARFQACAINFNTYIKKLFGAKFGIDDRVTYSIQFLDVSEDQLRYSSRAPKIPQRIRRFVSDFDSGLAEDEYNSPRYSYRLVFKRKLVNRPGQADKVIEFIDPNSEAAKAIDKAYWVKKEVEREKFRAKDVVAAVQSAGFPHFRVQAEHLRMWKAEDAKNPAKGYGVDVQGTWYWYQRWIDRCIELCRANPDQYR
jgi:hypothetical protein